MVDFCIKRDIFAQNFNNLNYFVMKSIVKIGLLFGLLAVISTGCKKYPEDDFTVRSAKWRLTRTWDLDKVEDNNGNSVGVNGTQSITFSKDGNYQGSSLGIATSGTWEFDDSKDNLILESDGGDQDTLKIIRLMSDDMILEEDNGWKYIYISE